MKANIQDVSIIGASSIDLCGFPKGKNVKNDSVIGYVNTSLGGVARNIAHNLSNLDVKCNLITAFSDGFYSKKIIQSCKDMCIRIDDSLFLKNKEDAIYISILDEHRELEYAIASMDIFDNLDVEFFKSKVDVIQKSKVCVIETDIPKDSIEFLLSIKGVDFFLDPVSSVKSIRAKECLGSFHTVKLNKIEGEALSNIKINSKDDIFKMADWFLNIGVKNIFITLSNEGSFYTNGNIQGFISSNGENIKNVTGAGDAYMAGLIYSHINSFDIKRGAKFSNALSYATLLCEESINDNVNVSYINELLDKGV